MEWFAYVSTRGGSSIRAAALPEILRKIKQMSE
jgi:hypothetical protein